MAALVTFDLLDEWLTDEKGVLSAGSGEGVGGSTETRSDSHRGAEGQSQYSELR